MGGQADYLPHMNENSRGEPGKKRIMTLKTWLAVLAFGAVLGAVCWYAVHAWFSVPDQMTAHGYTAMILGIVFSVALGAGLMALVFWSHKKGYDR
jgi:hypothetical protein